MRENERAMEQELIAKLHKNFEDFIHEKDGVEFWFARESNTLLEFTQLSWFFFKRGVNSQGFARIRSKGDAALFGGYSTLEMKDKLQIPENRALADFLPDVTLKAKDFAAGITSFNVKKDATIRGETVITDEHVKNNSNVRDVLTKSGIYPEALPAEEDVKKLERKMKAEEKKLPKSIKKLTGDS